MNVKAQSPAQDSEGTNAPDRDKEVRTPTQVAGLATLTLPVIKPNYPAAELIRSAFKAAIARMQAADPDARRGEPEGVHRLRAATRRLRSELKAVSDLVDRQRGEHLEQELKWLAGSLGSVRDLDILCLRLQAAASPEKANGHISGSPFKVAWDGTLAPFFLALRDRHTANLRTLRDNLLGERYQDLMTSLTVAVESPAFKDDAWEPCWKALPPLAAEAWRQLKKGGRAIDDRSPDADLHEVRKLTKRARYTAELIAPALGTRTEKRARRFIRLTTQLQDVLGEHQDAIVATAELERFMAAQARDPEVACQAHALLETQHHVARTTRAKFFKIWKRLDRRRSLKWFSRKQKAGSAMGRAR
jgi:CHAD domain-containing protein